MCPGMAIKAAPSSRKDRGRQPADWEASTMRGTPLWRHRAAIDSMGRIKPNTLDTWVHTTASTWGVSSRRKASRAASRSKRGLSAALMVTLGMARRGRVTALCS